VETNNIRDWYSIPAECRSYVRDYMYGDLFRQDCAVVAREAAAYAEGLELGGDGKEVWVFDVDDTTLSNLPYYADTGFGYARGCSRACVQTCRLRIKVTRARAFLFCVQG
jgi:hypothetical protein